MKNIVSKKFEDQYLQSCNLEVTQNRKCIIYRIFKEKHIFEKYLLELDFSEKIALCNLRTGNHKLPISKQRYSNDDIDVSCTVHCVIVGIFVMSSTLYLYVNFLKKNGKYY